MPQRNLGACVSFGTFELDLRAGELRREGFKVKLQEQPFQVLAFLLEKPGEVVTRDEFRARVWTSDIFVDFDQGLNKAVNKIREALGDSAENPRFVETVARRGYRFIAPVSIPSTALQSAAPAPQRYAAAHRWIAIAVGVGILAFVLAVRSRPIAWAPGIARTTQLTNDGRIKAGLVTDGPRLYFLEWVGGKHAIAQVSATGGETYLLRDPLPPSDWGFDQILDISPDKQDLLLVREGPGAADSRLWLYRIVDGSIRQLGDIAADDARWSPDGRTLSYIRRGEVFVANADGTAGTKVEVDGIPRRVSSSPDTGRVRFCVEPNGAGDGAIWELQDGRLEARRIARQWPCDDGAWSPKDDSFLFPQQGELWAVARHAYLSGGKSGLASQLTRGASGFSSPVYSPDGHKVFAIGGLPRGELVRYETSSRSFVPYIGGMAADGAAFTADEQWIAYTSYPGHDLWRMRADGDDRLQITSGIEAYAPRWSPDSRRIAFMCRTPGKNWSVCLISAGGGAPEKLTGSDDEESDPDWSPDGASIAFTTESRGIVVADANTRRLAHLSGSKGKHSPKWSPVGHLLVAVDHGKLVRFDLESGAWTGLTSDTWAAWPSWSRDGRSIYFLRAQPTGGAVARIDVRSGRQETLASVVGLHVAGRLGLTPKDEPLILRDAGSHEVYALDLQE